MHSQLPFRNLHPCAAAIQPLPPSVHAARPAHHFIAFITSITQVSNVNRTAFSIRAQPSAKDFPHQLQQLSDWKSAFGTCCVPPSATDASKLSKWVRWARKAAKQGLLQDEQQQQLESLDFVWKPNVIDAKWHHNYHSLRCLLEAGAITLQQIMQRQQEQDADLQQQQQQQQQQNDVLDQQLQQQQVPSSHEDTQQQRCQQQRHSTRPDHQQQQQQQDAAIHTDTLQQQQQRRGSELDQHQHQQQQSSPEVYELSVWLQRQVDLYGKLKLTPVKVKLLRQLGVKLHRQSGPIRANLHPVLQGKDPQPYKRRPIMVQTATPHGRRAVGRLLQHWQHWQQQQQGAVAGQDGTFAVPDPEGVFMCMLGGLQKWKKKYGSCVVPAGVFDKPGLADWVQQIRLAKQAAAGGAAAAAAVADVGDGDGGRGAHKTTSSSSSSNDGSSISFVEAISNAEAVPTGAEDNEQQQQQQQGLVFEAAAAVPAELKRWHLQELDATGFCWQISQDDVVWHETFHKLRAIKQKHHHLDMHKLIAETTTVTATATYTEFLNDKCTNSCSSTGCSSEEFLGMSEWLQQQRELLGWSAWGMTQLSGSKETPIGQQKSLSKMQQRMLKDLGVQPLPPVIVVRK